MLYTDFIRKKMHNLSKIITASGYPLKIASKFNRKAVDYVIHGATVPGKNLVKYPYPNATMTVKGVTFTDNGDGSITVNGTAEGNSYYVINSDLLNRIDRTKTYTLSGGTEDVLVYIALYQDGTWENAFNCRGTPVVIDFSTLTDIEFNQARLIAYLNKDTGVDNVTIYPMLNEGETAEEYEPYVEYSVGDTTKNLLTYPYDYGNGIVAGIEYSVNDDGSLTAKGTATSNAQFFFKKAWHTSNGDFILEGGKKYTLSGCVDGAESTYYLQVALINLTLDKEIARVRCCTEPVILDLTEYKYNPGSSEATDYDLVAVKLYVAEGASIDKTIYPMINEGDTAAPFEPYSEYDYKITLKNVHGDTVDTAVIYTNSQIKDGEVMSYRADKLPELKLYKGENNITVETEVAPTSVDIRYYD